MRVTQCLNRQHLGFMFKKHWQVQGKRVVTETGAANELRARGIEVTEATDFVRPKIFSEPIVKINMLDGVIEKPIVEDETHPLWNDRAAHVYGDGNVLIEGFKQAQALTNSVHLNRLPAHIEEQLDKTLVTDIVDKSFQESVLASNVFDPQQEKLAKIKDPLRPAFVFPRIYGITDQRRTRLTIAKLLQHCERMAGRQVTSTRKIVNDAIFVVPIEKNGELVQFEISADTFISSKTPISLFPVDPSVDTLEIPNLFPLKETISIPTFNIYEKKDFYPIVPMSPYAHPHTVFFQYSPDNVKNLQETPVSESQIIGRSLMKTFAVAAARARSENDANVKVLSKPIVVQSVQTDGKFFHFGVLVLRTLDVSATSDVKNVYFSPAPINLYDECAYKDARPYLSGYNPQILKMMKVLYNNQ